MKRKLLTILLLLLCVFALTACFGEEEPPKTDDPSSPSEPEHTHIEVDIPAVSATCTESGLTAGKKCSECGEITVKQETVDALEHDFDDNGICSRGDYTPTVGLEYELNEDGESAALVSYGTATDKNIVISPFYNGKPVTVIDDEAFWGVDEDWEPISLGITSCLIPDTVTTIGMAAFAFNTELTEVTIPQSVTYIGECVFAGCDNMIIKVADGNTTYHVDGNCLIETASKKVIQGGKSSVIPSDGSVTEIGYGAFTYSSITDITIPDTIINIGDWVFSDCYNLTSITIPDSVTSIGEYAFDNCSSLSSITIGQSVKNIGEYAFDSCIILTSINIPNGVVNIGVRAFSGCVNLTRITIPDSITSVGNRAFADCPNLAFNEKDGVKYLGNDDNSYVVVMEADTSITSVELPSTVKVIYASAFSGCESLTSITIPDSVTSIGWAAFKGCTNLTSVTIPDNVTSIGWAAFSGCSSLTSITIPDSVTSIGDRAFEDCSSLTSVTIGNSVTSIDEYAFYHCSSLTSVTIGDSVTSIGDGAFSNCSSLTSITIPDSVTSIGERAFEACSSLTSVTIPNSVTSIGEYAFYHCSSLTDIYFTGTEEEWNAISKGNRWNEYYSNGSYYIINYTMHYEWEG